MMPLQRLDERDLEILRILEKDARTPWSKIARDLGVSEATIYLRVRRLVEEGILEGYTIKVNRKKLGLTTTLFILLRVEASSIIKVRDRLPKVRYLSELHQITGEYHFLAKITAPNREEASNAMDEIASIPGVQDLRILYSIMEVKRDLDTISSLIEWMAVGRKP